MLLRPCALAACLAALAFPVLPALAAPATALSAAERSILIMNTPRPLFFSALVALDTQQHRSLTLPAQRQDFSFAAAAHMLPLNAAEVAVAMHHYAIAFVREGEAVVLVALTGLPDTGNRYVNAQGQWRAGAYIPAYVRGYPFIAVRAAPGVEPVIAFDPNAADFKAPNGQALLTADGQASEQLKGILAFHGEVQALTQRTQHMTQALQAEGVLEDGQLNVHNPNGSPNGSTAQIGGFLVVNEAKLRALPPDALKRLMDADAIGLAYAHLFSMSNLGHLLTDAPELATPAATAPRRRSPSSKKAAE